jgi:hypothetical protein
MEAAFVDNFLKYSFDLIYRIHRRVAEFGTVLALVVGMQT